MKRPLLAALALASMAWAAAHDPVHRPLMADNQLYFYMAERAASGVPPHVSFVDSKNDLGTFVSAAAIRAGRAAGIDDVLASRLVSIAFTALSMILIAELAAGFVAGAGAGDAATTAVSRGAAAAAARALPSVLPSAATVAGIVAALALFSARGFAEHTCVGSNIKVFVVTFLLLAHVAMARASRSEGAASRGYDALAGLAAGAAFACWQPVLLAVAGVTLEALVSKRGGVARAALVLAAACVPFALQEAWFAWHGALGEQLYQAYVMTLGSVHTPARLLASLEYLVTEAGGSPSWWRIAPLSFVLALVGGLHAVVRRPSATATMLRERGGLLSFVFVALTSTAFTLYDHQGVPDLFFPDPYFAVATGFVVAAAMRGAARLGGRKAATLVAVAAVAALGIQLRDDERRRAPDPYPLEDQRRLAEFVKIYREEFGEVWVYGAVHLLGLAHLDNHVPYGLFYDDVASVLSIDTWLPLRDGRMPEIIVHTRGQLPGGPAYLDADYVEITPPAFAAQSAMVWRRVSSQPGAVAAADWRGLMPPPRTAAPAPLPAKGPAWERAHRPAKGARESGQESGPGANRR